MSLSLVFSMLCAVWAASELWLAWRKRSADGARRRDGGTLRLLLVTLYAGIGLAVWAATLGIAQFPHASAHPLQRVGTTMMAVGIAVRWWAIRVLAEFFTVDVAIVAGHRIVRSGPYRWLRHPSYIGALLTFFGFALALGNGLSLSIVVPPVTPAFLWRIHIEERVLRAAFPQADDAYAAQTWRLLPFAW